MSAYEYNEIPPEHANEKRWIVWQYETRQNKNGEIKQTKVPYTLNKQHASSTDPKTWLSLADAIKLVETEKYNGIGYCFSEEKGDVGIDLDHVIDGTNPSERTMSPEAQKILDRFETYSEITPSKHGIHIMARGHKPPGEFRCKTKFLEIYTSGRYFTYTGWRVAGKPTKVQDCQDAINWLYATFFDPEPVTTTTKLLPPDPEPPQSSSNKKPLRKGFQMVWDGTFDIRAQKQTGRVTSQNESSYWKGAYREFFGCGYTREEIFQQLAKTQPEFDQKEAERNLGAPSHQKTLDKRPSTTFYKKLFPEVVQEEKDANPKKKSKGSLPKLETIQQMKREHDWGLMYMKYTILEESQTMIPLDECFIPMGGKIIGRGQYNTTFYYLCRRKTGWYVLDAPQIHTILHNNGASSYIAQKMKNWLATVAENEMRRIKMCFGYGFKQTTLDRVFLPPRYLAGSVKGFGDILIGSLRFPEDPTENENAVECYKNILTAAKHGIGDTKALVIGGFSLACLARERLCMETKIFPILHLIGPPEAGKSYAAGYLGNVANIPIQNVIENADTVSSPAVFSQEMSAGFIPIGIDEGRDRNTFQGILSQILQSATGPTSRKRLNADGSKRDDLPVLRGLMILSNHEIKELKDPETQTRIIRVDMLEKPTNGEEWETAMKAFDCCEGSVLVWCYEICKAKQMPNLNDLVVWARAKMRELAIKFNSTKTSRNNKKIVAILWGLRFLETILKYPVSEEEYEKVFVYCIKSMYTSLHPTAGLINTALAAMNSRYLNWEKDRKLLKELAKGPKGEEKSDPAMNISTVQSRLIGYEREGLCKTEKDKNDIICYAVFDGLIPQINRELRDKSFILDSKMALKSIFTEIGVNVLENKYLRIPWIRGDGVDSRRPCYLIPVNLPGEPNRELRDIVEDAMSEEKTKQEAELDG